MTTPDTEKSRALDALVGEAREHLDAPDLDWSRLESRLMAAVEEEKPALLRDVERSSKRTRLLRAGAAVFAAAAAVLLFARREPDTALSTAARPIATDSGPASALRESVGSGNVRVGGIVATPGYVLRQGDVIDVDRARGVFERARKVSWLLEQDSGSEPARARVKSVGDALVLGLDHGSIEAQVVPVPAGEAFAVDIATERTLVRVAVHGTHLRVTRAGSRVVVDLTEGVVSIGVPPRSGVTYGTTVTAPAHVELDATDLGTLRIDHAPAAVRAAIPLANAADPARAEAPAAPPPSPQAPLTALTVAPKPAPREGHVAPPAKVEPAAVAKGVALAPRDAIATAVRECAAARSRPGEVHVTVSSSLQLTVAAGGNVESARFSPPLSPDIQECAAQAIYQVKLDEPGLVTIPIEFSY